MFVMHWVHHVPKSKIAQLMDVHPSTVQRVVQRVQTTGSVTKCPLQCGSPRALNSIDCAVSSIPYACSPVAQTDHSRMSQYVESLIERTPDITLQELKEDLEINRGVSVNKSTVYRTLIRHGFTLKRSGLVAKEHVEEDRVRYMVEIAQNFHPDQLVFVDKSAMNWLTMRRPRGWSPVGCRSHRRDFFVRGTRCVIIAISSFVQCF
jgi:transposase